MTDIVERLRRRHTQDCIRPTTLDYAANVIESLRQQLDQTIEDCAKKLNEQGKQLAESQARVKQLEAALGQSCEDHRSEMMYECGLYCAGSDEALKQAKREALLEAADQLDDYVNTYTFYRADQQLRRMAEELK